MNEKSAVKEVLLLAKVLLLNAKDREVTISATDMAQYIADVDNQSLCLKQDFSTKTMSARFYLEAYDPEKDNRAHDIH